VNKADSEKLARIFKALSVDSRVRMLGLLKDRSLCVNALARILEISPAAVSQHLRILRDADILKPEKRGYFVHYRVNEKVLWKWRKMADGLLNMDKE
jgi:DNA-binding transcriptional ArsR family regulator